MKDKKVKNKKEKVRRFPKFYVLDVVIVLLIISVLLGIYFRYSVFDMFGNSKNQVEVEVSFSIKNINYTTGMHIDINDKVYFKSDASDFGVIMASTENSQRPLREIPAQQTVNKDGEFITIHYPADTRIDAEGKIKCKGTFANDGSFMLNGNKFIASGQTETVCTERVTVSVTITDIVKIAQ